jgi:hypothetical protein
MFCECEAPGELWTSPKVSFWWGQMGLFQARAVFLEAENQNNPTSSPSIVLQHHQFAIHRSLSGHPLATLRTIA